MDFSDPPRKAPAENLLPMINVVFLLLIFFLISAQLTAPEPFPVTPPEAEAAAEAEAAGDFTLYLDAGGEVGYRDATGLDAALAALAAARARHCAARDCEAAPPTLALRADGAVPAARLAGLLPALGQLGFARVDLVTVLP